MTNETTQTDARHPQIIAGALRAEVESLEDIINATRLHALLDEMDASILLQQLSASVMGSGWGK